MEAEGPLGQERRSRSAVGAWLLLMLFWAARLPAIVQPLGPDQAIYTYIGDRMLQGELPYRDAWDQKPPGLHAAYAMLRALWPADGVVPLADAVLAGIVAVLLFRLAPVIVPSTIAGPVAAGLFLLLGNPSFGRLGGARVRGQGEVFIGALVTCGVWMVVSACRAWHRGRPGAWQAAAAGWLVGAAALVKYPAAGYLLVVWALAATWPGATGRERVRRVAVLAAWSVVGFAIPLGLTVAVFASGGTLGALWDATVRYNLMYSGETYAGASAFVRYLLAFPIQHARVDGLWLTGGAGSLVVIGAAVLGRQPALLLPAVWVAVACLAVAVNGSRGLPQYFLQAFPPLALAAGAAAGWLVTRPRPRRARALTGAALVVFAALTVPRVISFRDAWDTTVLDARRLSGRLDEASYLARFAGRPGDKYSAPDVIELGRHLGSVTLPGEPVYVFGFSSGAYVYADRPSASRFFWSMPVINRFNDGLPGYGVAGLLADLHRKPPAAIALQRGDFGVGAPDSRDWFLSQPSLATWLNSHYALAKSFPRYDVYLPSSTAPVARPAGGR